MEEDDAGRRAKRKAKSARDSEARRARMATDPEYAEERRRKNRERNLLRYHTNPEYRERALAYCRERHRDPVKNDADKAVREKYRSNPEVKERLQRAVRERERNLRSLPEGHDGTCDICGVRPPPKSDGKRGLCQDHRHDTGEIRGYVCIRCNRNLAILDLRFENPDYFAALMAFSLKGAPVKPVAVPAGGRRRKAVPHPTLFGISEEE